MLNRGGCRFVYPMRLVASKSPLSSECSRGFGSGVRFSNPFHILGVSQQSDYATVKSAFLRAAMKHHPDQSGSEEEFLRVRAAFEQIVADLESQKKKQPTQMYRSEKEFQAWFRNETQQFLSFEMNDATVKEVINVYKTMASAGKDKGGYWEMARLVTERQANSKHGDSIAQISDQSPNSSTMRRKKRR